MDKARYMRREIHPSDQTKDSSAESRMGAATFFVFALCLIVLMLGGTVRLLMLMF